MTSINLKYVFRLLASLLLMMSLSMAVPAIWTAYEYFAGLSDPFLTLEVLYSFIFAIVFGFLFSLILIVLTRKAKRILGKREALLLVSLTWFSGAALAAIPFWIWARIHEFVPGEDQAFFNYINAYFESMSGLTTTGSTILSQIETIPNGLLLWRAFIHWLGGLGIVVIFVSLLPSFGGGTKRLFSVEATGISNEGITPRIKDTARNLLFIYIGFTIAEVLLIKFVDPNVSWFSAVAHTFATLATGGYSTLNASAGGLSESVQWVVIVFMLLAGVNFGLYQSLFKGKFREVFGNSELKFYLLLIVVATLILFFSINGTSYHLTNGELASESIAQYLRDAIFQTVSIITTTGFCSANFEEWSLVAKATLIFLMFVGGCGGSTGGGIKVIRVLAAFKIMLVELERAFRPNVVRSVKIGSYAIDFEQRLAVIAYVLGIILLSGLGAGVLLLTEDSITGVTSITATISAVNNIGPGLEQVGAIENYAWFSDLGKIVLSLLMAIGRLEVFSVLVIFVPSFWRTH